MINQRILCGIALLTFACSGKKKNNAVPQEVGDKTEATALAPATKGLAEGPHKVERTPLQKQLRKSAQGESFEWQLLGGIQVKSESFEQVYASRGSFFISFKADIVVADQDCLIRWKTDLLEGPTGRGTSVESIEGVVPATASQTLTVSGVVALSAKDVGRVGSASAGYWTLCGDALPHPSALDFAITATTTEEIKLGNAFDLHHTVLQVESKVKEEAASPQRCHFNLVAEDVNAKGYTLNRDFASYSLAAGESGQVKLRRTTFEGGNEMDFSEKAAGKRSYLNEVACVGPWQSKSARLEGIAFKDLQVHRQDPTTQAGQEARASFDHSATISNTLGKDCSFRVRYRMLDKNAVPLHKAPVLSEVLHLRKGAVVKYHSDKHRLYTWLDQADDVAQLVVEEATPLADCKNFDAKQALAK